MAGTVAPGPIQKALDEGLQVAAQVEARSQEALREHTARRIWLAASLAPILIVIVLLLLYIRTLRPLTTETEDVAEADTDQPQGRE